MNSFLSLFVIYLSLFNLVVSLPIIIGHRGASGNRPENTLASWETAIHFGSDYVEADIASTKDHVLIASHNPDITHNTDVADHPEFADRYKTKNISGEIYEGYFVDEFTLAEIKTLRTRERYPFRSQAWNGLYPMATLQEFLTLVKAKEAELGKRIGIYLETKHPQYYRSIGLPLEEILVETLHKFGYQKETDPAFIESFESNLVHISKLTKLPLVQLISGTEGDKVQFDTGRKWTDFITEKGLREVATYASTIAPHKSVILKNQDGQPVSTSFIQDAHAAGLMVHVWTFRKEREHFEKHETRLFGTIEEEMNVFFDMNVDGIFTDQPDIGFRVKNEMYSSGMGSLSLDYLISILFSLVAVVGLIKLTKSNRSGVGKATFSKLTQTKSEQSNTF